MNASKVFFWYFEYILLLVLVHLYLSKIFNAGLSSSIFIVLPLHNTSSTTVYNLLDWTQQFHPHFLETVEFWEM